VLAAVLALIQLILNSLLLHVGQDASQPANGAVPRNSTWGKVLRGVVIVVDRQSDLLKMISALHPPGGFTG
jgi:hypothetical protein